MSAQSLNASREVIMRNRLHGTAVIATFLFFSTICAQAQFVGSAKCKVCHLPQTKSWEETKLPKTFDLLKPGVAADLKATKKLDPNKDYTHDAACLGCHTTGYAQPGGFESIEKTPNLAGVQCEVCHGAGANYTKADKMSLQNKEYKRGEIVAAGLVLPTQKTCETCHNAKSPFFKPFDFAARKQQAHQHVPLRYPH